MNSKNKRLLVMMVTSALMTCPALINGQEPAAAAATAATSETGYEPASGEAIPNVTAAQPTAANTTSSAEKQSVSPQVNSGVPTRTTSSVTGYESSEELNAAAQTSAAPAASSAAGVMPVQTTTSAATAGETGYEPQTEEKTAATEQPAATETAVPASSASPELGTVDQSGIDKKFGYFPGMADAVIDTTTLPTYPIASLSQAEQASLPYGTAVTDAAVAPYTGKTATSVSISPLPDQKLDAILQRQLAMRVGDAVNIDYIRHDVNVIGGTGLFSTVTPSFTPIPEGVALDYKVQVNPVINKIEITGNESCSTDQLYKVIATKPGMTLNTVMVSKDVAAINALFNNAGYLMSRVTNVNMDDQGVLHIDISEGHLQDIIVKGNSKTKTYVITRELKIKKGQIFNKDSARRSIERIYNTGYFEDVNVRLLPGTNKNDVIMEIDVVEQKTGSVTIGAGYSDSNGLVGILGLSDSNFRGRGDQASINWEFGGDTDTNKNYIFSYTHPWMNDHGDSIGFSIFNNEVDYDDYNQKGDSVAEYYKRTTGFNLTYGRVRSEYVRDYVTFETKKTDYAEYESGYNYDDYPGYLSKNFGRTNSLTWSHVFDNRDNVFDPTRGKRLSFTGVMAGHGLGGDFDFYKLMAESRTYYKVGRAQVLAVRLMGGIGFGDMPYNDLFTLGGSDTLRGYEDDEFRGNRFYEGTVEYRYPIAKKIKGVVFADTGNAWGGTDNIFWYDENNKCHVDAGLGVRVTTPIGPIRLDYAWGSNGGKFSFSFGGQF